MSDQPASDQPAVGPPARLANRLTLPELLDGYHEPAGRLFLLPTRGPGASTDPAGDALAALAHAHALAEAVLRWRWIHVRHALAGGATLDTVADAMGLTVGEVRVGFTRWADDQLRLHQLSDRTHAQLLGLLDRR